MTGICRADRSDGTVRGSIELLLALCEKNLPQVHAVLQQDNRDIVVIVLDVQRDFIENVAIVQLCGTLCCFFISTWTAPTQLVCDRVVSTIVGCLQQYPEDWSCQMKGCQQLFDLCKCNGSSSSYTRDTMQDVVYVLQQIHYEWQDERVRDDRREWHLWTFVDKVMQNPSTYSDCVGLFGVGFLKNALVCYFSAYYGIKKFDEDDERRVDCVQFICRLLQRIVTANPAAMAAFAGQDGISALVKIVHQHIQTQVASYYMTSLGGHTLCLDLLLDVLFFQQTLMNTAGVFAKVIFDGRKVQRKFCITKLSSQHMATTIPILLIQSLSLSTKLSVLRDEERQYTIYSASIVDKTLYFLSQASNESKLVSIDMMQYMRQLHEFVSRFVTVVQRDIPAVANDVLLRVVYNYDIFILNVYSEISVDCEYEFYSLWSSKGLQAYILNARRYRHVNSTFEAEILNIVKALSDNQHMWR